MSTLFKLCLFLFTACSSLPIWAYEEIYQGSYVYADGSRYEGQWKGGKRSGYGVQSWPNGARYEGWWHNDLRHGNGLFVWRDGSYYDGKWYNNWPGNHLQNPNIFAMYNLPEMEARYPRREARKSGLILESIHDFNNAFSANTGEYELLSKGLALKGIDATPIHFSSAWDLQQKIAQQPEFTFDIIWLRAHGGHNGQTFNCGSDVGTAELLVEMLADRLTPNAVIVLDSCDTGAAHGLAENLRDLLCQKGLRPRIIAPSTGIAYSGFDMEAEELRVLMIDPLNGVNVARTLQCSMLIPFARNKFINLTRRQHKFCVWSQ